MRARVVVMGLVTTVAVGTAVAAAWTVGATELTRTALALVKQLPCFQGPERVGDFMGYCEGKEIFKGAVDVVVCDGFVGNVVLKSLEGLGSANFPVGMFSEAEYQSARVQFEPGDFLVIYTDGVSEATNTRNELFEEFRLRQIVEEFTACIPEQK